MDQLQTILEYITRDLNPVAVIAIVILLFYVIRGVQYGLVRTVFLTFGFLVAIVVAINTYGYVSHTLQSTAVAGVVERQVEKHLFKDWDSASPVTVEETEAAVPQEEIVIGESAGSSANAAQLNPNASDEDLINSLPLPAVLKKNLIKNNTESVYKAFGIDELKKYIANYLTGLIFNVLSFILVYAGVMIILTVAVSALDLVAKLPVIHSMNKLGGLLFGLVNGLVVLWIICLVVTVFSGTGLGSLIYAQINENPWLRLIYNNNYLLVIMARIQNIVQEAGALLSVKP